MKRLVLILALLFAATRAEAADKLTLMLDWFVNPDHAPIIVAAQKGFFTGPSIITMMLLSGVEMMVAMRTSGRPRATAVCRLGW